MPPTGEAVLVSEGVYNVGGDMWRVGKRYTIHRCLGAGSYGQVCLATDNRCGTQVALKRCPDVLDTRNHAKGALREVCIMRRLLPHENIIELRHIFAHPAETGRKCLMGGKLVSKSLDLYLVEELAPRGDLYTLHRTLTTEEVRAIMQQLLLAMRFVHHHAIWHRDVKSQNVLLAADGKVKLCDFGQARSASSPGALGDQPVAMDLPLSRASDEPMTSVVATPCYRAPEVIMLNSGHYTEAIDTWGLGCIFAELLQRLSSPTAKPLFSILNGEMRSPSTSQDYQAGSAQELDTIFAVVGSPSVAYMSSLPSEHWRKFLEKVPRQEGNLRQQYQHCGEAAVDLIVRMLDLDPSRRLSTHEALAHPFFQGLPAPPLLPPLQDNSLWGQGMDPPPPVEGDHAMAEGFAQSAEAQRGGAVDLWETRDPARALEALEAMFAASVHDDDKGEARLRAVLQRECDAVRLQQKGYFFGQKPVWWDADGVAHVPGGGGGIVAEHASAGWRGGAGTEAAASRTGRGGAAASWTGRGGAGPGASHLDLAAGLDHDMCTPGGRRLGSGGGRGGAAGDLAGLDGSQGSAASLEGLSWLSLEVGPRRGVGSRARGAGGGRLTGEQPSVDDASSAVAMLARGGAGVSLTPSASLPRGLQLPPRPKLSSPLLDHDLWPMQPRSVRMGGSAGGNAPSVLATFGSPPSPAEVAFFNGGAAEMASQAVAQRVVPPRPRGAGVFGSPLVRKRSYSMGEDVGGPARPSPPHESRRGDVGEFSAGVGEWHSPGAAAGGGYSPMATLREGRSFSEDAEGGGISWLQPPPPGMATNKRAKRRTTMH